MFNVCHIQYNLSPSIITLDIQNKYWYKRCQYVFKNAASISCDSDHLFCKSCLDEYFGDNELKSCPQCRQEGLNKNNIKLSQFNDRIINSFKIKCSLQMKEEEEKVAIGKCEWNGDLLSLDNHINNNCPLKLIKCKYCNKNKKRFQLEDHDKLCPLKPIPCLLNCGM